MNSLISVSIAICFALSTGVVIILALLGVIKTGSSKTLNKEKSE